MRKRRHAALCLEISVMIGNKSMCEELDILLFRDLAQAEKGTRTEGEAKEIEDLICEDSIGLQLREPQTFGSTEYCLS